VIRLRGSVVLVTGASSGIGEATALAFARRKARLALCARRTDRLHSVAERCRRAGSPEVIIRKADVGQPADARAFVAAALQVFDRIDVLINNAGVGWRGRFIDMSEAEASELFATNVMGALWVTQAVLPSMLAARRGVIVNVSSVTGFRAVPYSAAYSASKYALTGLSHALRGELSGSGIKVSVVYPGSTRTEFAGGAGPLGPWVKRSDQVAATIVRTVRWPRRDVVAFPYRAGKLAEPFLGGLMDHFLGEMRRRQAPELGDGGWRAIDRD
jgi:short-subunit dehydrogenase